MNEKKLEKLRGDLAAMRRSPQKARDLEQVASRLGRKKHTRGKHPMWISERFDLPPLSIPHHGGKDLSVGTRNGILNLLEDDLLAWEEHLGSRNGEDS